MPTRAQITFGAIVAGVSAFVAMLSGLLTLYSQVDHAVSGAIRKDFAPVGTVVASVLPPDKFAAIIGEDEGDAYTKRKWILADGREVIDTAYARAKHNKPVPNLQGMFLRGIDLKTKRDPGDVQEYATALPKRGFIGITDPAGSHVHDGGFYLPPGDAGGDRFNAGGHDFGIPRRVKTDAAGEHTHTLKITAGGDDETRPINVAVYYYIKIN